MGEKGISKEKLINVLYLCVYKIFYEVIYVILISKIYAYYELGYYPNWKKAVISYLLFFIIAFLPQKKNSVSKYLLNIFMIFTIIPLLSIYWQKDYSTSYVVVCTICYIILHVICEMRNDNCAKKIVIYEKGKQIKIRNILVALIGVMMILFIFKYGLADLRALNLANVYDVREDRTYTGLWAYIVNWISYSFVPCLLCISLVQKSKLCFLFSILVQLYMFLFTGSKTTLFSIGLIIVSYWIIYNRKNFLRWWAALLTGLTAFTSLLYVGFGELFPLAVFPVRLLCLPAAISNRHYNFFSQNPKLYFSENFIGRIFNIESPYNKFSTFLVSNGSGNANTGYLGDAYDNAGFLCMIVYTIILALILRYIDRIYNSLSEKSLSAFVAAFTYSMIYLNDGTLTALIMTGGLIFSIFIFMQYRDDEEQQSIDET